MRDIFQKTKTYIKEHERPLMAISFAAGFVWDSLTLTRVDFLYDNAVLTGYIVIAVISMFLFHAYDSQRLRGKIMDRIAPWFPILISFAFGGLMSGYIVYYSRSASLAGSWMFILFLIALFVGNEVFKTRYQRLSFQISILFVVLFSYSIFSVPVLVGSMGALVFVGSGIVSLVLVALVVYGLYKISPSKITEGKYALGASIGGLFILFNIAYFANLIPPIPLSLKDIGIYHQVAQESSGKFYTTYEPAPWYTFYRHTNAVYHKTSGEPVYAFSAVFAPTRITIPIYHRWSYFDEQIDSWVEASSIRFSIKGGRDEGYRGYSKKYSTFPGKWRVDVVTERGQVIGRIQFRIEDAPAPTIANETK